MTHLLQLTDIANGILPAVGLCNSIAMGNAASWESQKFRLQIDQSLRQPSRLGKAPHSPSRTRTRLIWPQLAAWPRS